MAASCEECYTSSEFIKPDYQNGCYVCTNCGNVTSTLLLDERPTYITTTATMHHEDEHKADGLFYNLCGFLLLPDTCANMAQDIFDSLKPVYKVRTNVLQAASFCIAVSSFMPSCKTLEKTFICDFFGVQKTDKLCSFITTASDCLQIHKKTSRTKTSDQLTRFIKSLKLKTNTQDIMAEVSKIEERLKLRPEFVGKKPSKFGAVITFHVLTCHFKLHKMDKQNYCDYFDISITTLNKYLKQIHKYEVQPLKICRSRS